MSKLILYYALLAEGETRRLGEGGEAVGVIGFLPTGEVCVQYLCLPKQDEREFVAPGRILGRYESEENARVTARIVETQNGPSTWRELKALKRHSTSLEAVRRKEDEMRRREDECFRLNAMTDKEVDDVLQAV